MDQKKSILNITVSVVFQIITMVLGIVIKRLLIDCCGNTVNGLNTLYLSIIGVLSVAELGVGSAITFGMYRPIVKGNHQQVSALYHLYHRLYIAIGAIVFAGGLIVIPFLPSLAADYEQLDVPLASTFLLMLISSVLTFFFGAKTALINAYKNNYITTAINSGGIVLQYVLQAATLLLTRSFAGFLACRIISVIGQWGATHIITRKNHKQIISTKADLEPEIKKNLVKNIRAMFMHKIGGLLVNTVDSVVISAFIGVAILGKYSNYTAILLSMTSVIMLVFTSMISVIGHMCVTSDKETSLRYSNVFHWLNFCIAMVFFLGYFAVADNLISILFSSDLLLERTVIYVASLNAFIQFMRRSVMLFRDATGTFYNDRWMALIEGVVNLILSVALVRMMGITGVIVATSITALCICHIVEPYVLYKNIFSRRPIKYYIRNYAMIAVYAIAQLLMQSIMQTGDNQWKSLLINGMLSLAISLPMCGAALVLSKDMRMYAGELIKHKILRTDRP